MERLESWMYVWTKERMGIYSSKPKAQFTLLFKFCIISRQQKLGFESQEQI